MIRILATGTLHTEPTSRTSANGNPYTTAKLRADDGKGGSVWCNLIAFGSEAERVAIGKAVEEELGKRQGQRTDLVSEDQEEMFGEIPQNFAELSGKETLEIAASKSGFGNKETYRQAKTVTENATPGYWPPSNRSHPPPRSLTAATRSEKSSLLKVRVASTTPACRLLQPYSGNSLNLKARESSLREPSTDSLNIRERLYSGRYKP